MTNSEEFNEHYKVRKVETIEKMELIAELCSDYLTPSQLGSVYMAVKYIDRMGEKDGEPIEKDAIKARNYLVRAINGKKWPWEHPESIASKARSAGDKVGDCAILEALAEEAAELAQAALKLARKARGENPTPKSAQELTKALVEEFSDLQVCAIAIGLEADDGIMDFKADRWLKRISEKSC